MQLGILFKSKGCHCFWTALHRTLFSSQAICSVEYWLHYNPSDSAFSGCFPSYNHFCHCINLSDNFSQIKSPLSILINQFPSYTLQIRSATHGWWNLFLKGHSVIRRFSSRMIAEKTINSNTIFLVRTPWDGDGFLSFVLSSFLLPSLPAPFFSSSSLFFFFEVFNLPQFEWITASSTGNQIFSATNTKCPL